jgi:hypothetical protein
MRVLKKILIGLGSLIGLIIASAVLMGLFSARFKSQQTPLSRHS